MRPLALLAVVLTAGCGAGDPHGRRPVAGTVTFGGAPLDKGAVQFLPADPANGFRASALVRDGRFQIPQEQGLPPGPYKVAVTSPAPGKGPAIEPADAPGMKMPPLGTERIPAAYNTATKLAVTVTADGPNDFELTIP